MLLDLVRATDELPESGLVALCEAARALATARATGLTLSSRLLRLAREVRE